jgi:signal transduction histidine kinase
MAHDMLIYRTLFLHGLLMVCGFPFIVTAALITERRRHAETLQATRRNLLNIQEQASHRIARKLHADIVGRLTLLGLNVDKLRTESNASAGPTLDQLYVEISDAFQETLDLSHEVHSFMVEYLGLATALKKLCRDAGKQSDVNFDFSVESVPLPLSSVVSHRLFRVAKEALRNVAQHSCAKTAAVKLTLRGERVVLRIADDGIGMGPQCDEGSGITYMREQVLSLGGTFKLLSAPSKGTVVEASVPIKTIDLAASAQKPL